ncbi:ABC transporter substrate-binding protein [Aeromicrobium sp. CF4.19]|uniref:ABC transporter substrate-binding protein n=1 Tax=Aeromicrobium sp. CF4.19 TaxID=3373082 RepID=UPI003EE4EF03
MNLRHIAAGAALALALPLAACGGSDDSGSGAWTYTDDVGTELSLDAAPERIVAHKDVAVALADMGLGDQVVATFGAPANSDPDLGLQSENLDLEEVEDVTGGGDYGDIDLERLAGLEPDLIITSTFGDDTLWYINDEVAGKLEGSYDIAVLNYEGETVESVLDNAERLATALGAEEADFEEGRTALADVNERLATVASEAGDPSILAVAPSADLLYVANTPAYIDLIHLRDEVGLDLMTPDESDLDEGGYWHNLSWENADFYDPDIAMWDSRGGEANRDMLEDQPVWNGVTAAEEDAYVPWRVETAPSALGYATTFGQFADDLEEIS